MIDLIWHPSSLEHDPGPGHPESPARLRAILGELRGPAYASMVTWGEAEPADDATLERVHPRRYVDTLRRLAEAGGGRLDGDTFMSRSSLDAARHAAGAAAQVVRRALDGTPAFALIRPPGHHALADTPMGFCLINNVVVAARVALEACGVERVLIVDWDVHHGNGTQALVETDHRIRYVSMHQWPLYPGTGRAEERGVGNIFNVPLPPGLSRDRYVTALDDAVVEATRGWRPGVILISAGFDAMAGDPLAGFTLEPDDYAVWIRRWQAIGAPTGAVLEGGYVPERIARAAGETVKALAAGKQ